ncbi:MAG: hypothetical protein H0V82_00155 [Candidatus Protochlamydia sp.]|nr:hypothetical protein [Candidatus Protochlamydia sp.]
MNPLPVSMEALYSAPSLFVVKEKECSTIKIVAFSALYALVGSLLSCGAVFSATASLPLSLTSAGAAALIIFLFSVTLQYSLTATSLSDEQKSLLVNIPSPRDNPEAFKRFTHHIATSETFANRVKTLPNPPLSSKIAPQLEALRLSRELGNVSIQKECENFLKERISQLLEGNISDQSFSDLAYVAECYQLPSLKNSLLEQFIQLRLPQNNFENFLNNNRIFFTDFISAKCRLTDEEANLLRAAASHLNHVHFLADPSFSDTGITHLSELQDIRSLRIKNESLITSNALASLLVLPHLEELEINSTHFTLDSLDLLARFPSLKKLSLTGGNHLSIEAFRKLGQLHHLQHLELVDFNVDNQALQLLTPHVNLTSLSLKQTIPVETSLSDFTHFRQLKRLEIDSYLINHESCTSVAALVQLETLSLRSPHLDDRALSALNPLVHLKNLNLKECHSLTSTGLNQLQSPGKYQRLDLSDTSIDISAIELSLFSNLECLKLRNGRNFRADGINSLLHLKHLDLSKTGLSEYDLLQLKENSQLEELDLRFSEIISGNALVHLTHIFPNLKNLYFHEVQNFIPSQLNKFKILEKFKKLTKISILNSPQDANVTERINQLLIQENFV